MLTDISPRPINNVIVMCNTTNVQEPVNKERSGLV
jgi:hypothetical protein